MAVTLVGLDVGDDPQRWAALGFRIDPDGRAHAGDVALTLGVAPPGDGIVGWTLAAALPATDLGGLRTTWRLRAPHPGAPEDQRNRVTAVDHVVVATPDFDGFAAALADRDLALSRTAELRGRRHGFRRLGRPILEVVDAPDARRTAFWGVTFAVAAPHDLDRLASVNRFVSEPHPAVQPGRRIATVDRAAGISTRVAFIDPE